MQSTPYACSYVFFFSSSLEFSILLSRSDVSGGVHVSRVKTMEGG